MTILNNMTEVKKSEILELLNKKQLKTVWDEFGDVVTNKYIDSVFSEYFGFFTTFQIQKKSGVNIKLSLTPSGKILEKKEF